MVFLKTWFFPAWGLNYSCYRHTITRLLINLNQALHYVQFNNSFPFSNAKNQIVKLKKNTTIDS